jgi:hypothetical protein
MKNLFSHYFICLFVSTMFCLQNPLLSMERSSGNIDILSPELNSENAFKFMSKINQKMIEVKIQVTSDDPVKQVTVYLNSYENQMKILNGIYTCQLPVREFYKGPNSIYIKVITISNDGIEKYIDRKFEIFYRGIATPENIAEENAYLKAVETNTEKGYKEFLKKYSNSFYVYNIEKRLQEVSNTNFDTKEEDTETRVKKLVTKYHGKEEYDKTLSNITNPYYFKEGEGYYIFNFKPQQWINKKTCLANIWMDQDYGRDKYSDYFYLDVGNFDVHNDENRVNVILKCIGTYKYTTVTGAKKIIPKFKLIDCYENTGK